MKKMKQLTREDKDVLIIIFGTVALLFFLMLCVISVVEPPLFFPSQPGLQHTTFYENVNVSQAKEIIGEASNLTIADCTGGCRPCNWKSGKVPDAQWIPDFTALYNSTDDILVYCKHGGEKSEAFCEGLVNHTYGKIYNLVGGHDAWVGG